MQAALKRIAAAVAASTLLMLLLGALARLEPIPFGLRSEITGGRERLSGDVFPLREGDYLFSTGAATPAAILIDGQPLTGPIHLTAAAHTILIERDRTEAAPRFTLFWARDGGSPEPVPEWELRARKVRSAARVRLDAALVDALAAAEWLWVGLLVTLAGVAAAAGLARIAGLLERACDWPALKWILGFSLILNIAGIWWGLPGEWVGNELKPQYILDAVSRHFSHGWFDTYPPMQFYLVSAAISPLLLLHYLDRITFDGAAGYALLLLISRLVSVVMAAGTVAAICVCGTRAFGRRAGVIAAAIVALSTPFLYHAKTANVDMPYLFWWALSMVFYVRLLQTGLIRDYVLFAAAGTLSICTKDQAYGLYLLAPFVIVEQIWRENRQAGVPHAAWRALVDRRLLAGGLVAAVLFALIHNLLFNADGFVGHVRYITGPVTNAYRLYEPTVAGHMALFGETIRLIQVSMGWPLFLAGTAGLAIAAAAPRLRSMTFWLLAPTVSYYTAFINVLLYNYDRFVLPMCFVLAIFGGLALDRMLSAGPRARRWGGVATAGAFAYTLLYAGTVDVLMMRDSRYDVERWAHAHIGRRELIAVSGLKEYLPRLDDFWLEDISTLEELHQEHPSYVVLNADYARAVPPETAWGQMIARLEQGTAGYRLVGRYRHGTPWPWLPGGHPDLVGPRDERIVFSTLRNINPTIEVFQREP